MTKVIATNQACVTSVYMGVGISYMWSHDFLQVYTWCRDMAIATPTEYGGYEYTFVDPPPDCCICNICHHPSREPYMTGECCRGQTICKLCLDQWQLRNTRRPSRCPVCGKKGNCNPHPNYPIEREVKSLKIYCTNKKKGCKWQGELRDINNHLAIGNSDGCKFQKVKCSNECEKMIEWCYLNRHIKTGCLRHKLNFQYWHDTSVYWGPTQREVPQASPTLSQQVWGWDYSSWRYGSTQEWVSSWDYPVWVLQCRM